MRAGPNHAARRWCREATAFVHEIVTTAIHISAAPTFGAEIVIRRDTQWALLRVLERRACCLAIADVARALGITRQSARQLVRAAATAGRVELLTNRYDRRIVQVELTSVGRSALVSKRAQEAAWVIALLNGLETREMRATARVLSVIRQRLLREEREEGSKR